MRVREVKAILSLGERSVGAIGCAETFAGREAPSAGAL